MDMWNYLDSAFAEFRTCFSRKAAFYSFVIIVMGFMLSTDSAGITSIIRVLGLEPAGYEALVHFFVPARGRLQPLGSNGYELSKILELCSWKMGCLYLSGTG
jgi:hypothetical protein